MYMLIPNNPNKKYLVVFSHLYVTSQCVILVKFGGEIFQNLVAKMYVVNTGNYSPVTFTVL